MGQSCAGVRLSALLVLAFALTFALLIFALCAAPSQALTAGSERTRDESPLVARRAAAPRLLIGMWSRSFKVRPKRIVNTGDGSSFIGYLLGRGGSIRWSKWTTSRAIGVGTYWINDGEPDMATGKLHPHRARLVASRVRNGRYTRLVVRFRGGSHVWDPGDEAVRAPVPTSASRRRPRLRMGLGPGEQHPSLGSGA